MPAGSLLVIKEQIWTL